MRVSFKYSQEDLVDATVRFAARSKAIRGIRRRALLWSVVLSVSLAILFFKFSILATIIFMLTGLVGVIINPSLYDRRYRNNLRKRYRENWAMKMSSPAMLSCCLKGSRPAVKTARQSRSGTISKTSCQPAIPSISSAAKAGAALCVTVPSVQRRNGKGLSISRETT